MRDCKTIVLIEDEDDFRENLRDLLAAHGFQVLAAAGGREGLELLQTADNPCFVLVDLLMPDMDGWELIGEIAKVPRLAAIPVCICTSVPDRAPSGFTLITKPVDVAALLVHVHRCCEQ